MKKTFKQADGTEVVVEGTAEELAELERRLRESSPKPNEKKSVLNG